MITQFIPLIAAVGIGGAVIYLSNQNNKKNRSEVQQFLIDRGYVISPGEYVSARHKENGLSLTVEDVKTGGGKTKNYYFTLLINAKVDINFQFTITRKGFFQNKLGGSKNYIPNNLNLNFDTPNPYYTQLLFSKEQLLSELDHYISNKTINSITVHSEGSGNVFIQINTRKRRVNSIMESLYWAEKLISVMRSMSYTAITDDDNTEYRCFNCQNAMSFVGAFCRNCGAIAPQCVICNEDPEPNDDVVLFDCCKTYAHAEHAKEWSSTNNTCPYCQTLDPKLVEINDTIKPLK